MKVRMRFSKTGTMKFIGHLDVMRFFQKTFRRAELDMIYSQGFNPHPLLSFASPLGVGLTSDGEYLDIQLHTCDSGAEMLRRINAAMTSDGLEQEMCVESIRLLPDDAKTSMALVVAADYRMDLKDGYEKIEDFEERFTEFLKQESIVIRKKTKNGETEIDLRPWIYQVDFSAEGFAAKTGQNLRKTVAQDYAQDQKIYMQVSAGSAVNIRPEQVMEAFLQYIGREYEPYAWQIHRMEMYASGETEGSLVALDELGEEM